MRIGVNLLWVRPGKNGGTESYIRNILDGLLKYPQNDMQFVLFVSKDNAYSFEQCQGKQFEMVVCPIETSSFIKRVIWENLCLSRYNNRKFIDGWFMPVYSRPFSMGKIPTVTVIHDLQALHYPEYFSKLRNMYFRISWRNDCKNSTKIITISEFCKNDILKHYHIDSSRVEVIYNPIIVEKESVDFESIAKKYGIEKKRYFYTVSSLAKHKNLITLLKAMKLLRKKGDSQKLIITGVKVNAESEIFSFIRNNGLDDCIVYTGFVSDEVRNTLYKYCKAFFFPSIFEGFGMPTIEAMSYGVPVITTMETSIPEVTENKAHYVNDPFNVEEWLHFMMDIPQNLDVIDMKKYSLKCVTDNYIKVFRNVFS